MRDRQTERVRDRERERERERETEGKKRAWFSLWYRGENREP